ncbi:outer membrane protein assembly factor BamB family protein [Haloarchaeobius amylolyticus]|uniref:outer membrane protein assembly factor BamB family protein n=1 Tax=Haloarchaeobius amylolyticus TaxID=1198296 RepID=UPI00226F64A6|nr:PQQ-binding-like beta-propeller repeat protein [Haloarchaeobius amylolyticus]
MPSTDPPSLQSAGPAPRSQETDSGARPVSRRALLATVATGAATALAGCNALDSGGDTAPFHAGDWYDYGNGPANANRVAGGAPKPDSHETLATSTWAYGPPVVHDGVVYFAADRGAVAVTAQGTELWTRDLAPEVSGAAALDPGRDRLYVPTSPDSTTAEPDSDPASVTVLSTADGSVVDSYRVGDDVTYGVTVVDGDLFVRSATTCLRLGPDGTERWRRALDPLEYDEYNLGDSTATQVAPAVTDDGVYVPDRDAVVKLDPDTGKERWRVPVDTAYAATVATDDVVVQTGWQESVAVEPSGEIRWRRDLGTRGAAAVAGEHVYLVPGDLHELDAESGQTNWQAHVPDEGTAAPVVTDDAVVVATGDLRAFNRDAGGFLGPDRLRWRDSSVHAGSYCSPVVADGRVFVAGPNGLVGLRPAR